MITEFLRAWAVVPAISAALWHSGFVVGLYGLELGKKVFVLHYSAEMEERNSNRYSL